MSTTTTFKRVEIGVIFQWKGSRYRKTKKRFAVRLDERGVGNTANPVPFTRSAAVDV